MFCLKESAVLLIQAAVVFLPLQATEQSCTVQYVPHDTVSSHHETIDLLSLLRSSIAAAFMYVVKCLAALSILVRASQSETVLQQAIDA